VGSVTVTPRLLIALHYDKCVVNTEAKQQESEELNNRAVPEGNGKQITRAEKQWSVVLT
jgi:hypothetical protein